MRYKNNIGPQVRRRRYALGWSQSDLATKLQLAGFDTSRSGVSKIEARLSYVDDKTLLYLAEVLKSAGAGTLPREDARQSNSRVHGEARDDAILTRRLCENARLSRQIVSASLYPAGRNGANRSKSELKLQLGEIVVSA